MFHGHSAFGILILYLSRAKHKSGGLYVIYRHKEILGKEHLTTAHSLAGIVTMVGTLMASMAGGIFLHPDFGVDKTNQTIR